MSLHYLQYSQSVIVNVLRAIVSRSISTTPHLVKSIHTSSVSRHAWSSTPGIWLNTSSCKQKASIIPSFGRRFYSTPSIQTSTLHQDHHDFGIDTLLDDMHATMDDHTTSNSNPSTSYTVRTSPKGKTKYYEKVYVRGHDKLVTGYHFKDSKKKPQTVEEYKKRILFAVINNQQNKAIKYLREMEHRLFKPDAQTYTIIINGYSKQSDMVRARKWMKRMIANGKKPDVHTYTSMIDGYMRQCNVDKAEGIFKTMMNRRVQPNLVMYNVLMQHSVMKLDMETAVRFWGKLSEAGLQPDVHTYAILIHGLGDDGLVDVNHVVATTLMGIHVKHKDNAYAIQLFQDFFGDGLAPTRHTHNVLLNAAMGHTDVAKINGYYQQFLSLVDHNTQATDSDHDNNNDTSTNDNNTTAYLSLWGDHPNVSNHVYTYTSFMRAYLRHDDLGMVSQVYQDMLQRKIKPTLVTFATLMLAHAFVPDPHACENILKELQSHDIKVNVALYTIVMRAWAKAKNWDQVKRVYDEMKSENIEPNKMTMEVLRWAKEEVVP
ncbi:hypothetical protein BCR42DRAFT_410266 [Absidia repens]|uniref:Pentacotripeptide-repeat region of PRORP domain-containing protein n=1 Tax=Absidia repens TaxID=90262 RepID=A0A1X2INU3_9FUNG|nr:hypothetical protein BCR42DRAFT_410266 [Absidia repens]